jgi:hypothetical protein
LALPQKKPYFQRKKRVFGVRIEWLYLCRYFYRRLSLKMTKENEVTTVLKHLQPK